MKQVIGISWKVATANIFAGTNCKWLQDSICGPLFFQPKNPIVPLRQETVGEMLQAGGLQNCRCDCVEVGRKRLKMTQLVIHFVEIRLASDLLFFWTTTFLKMSDPSALEDPKMNTLAFGFGPAFGARNSGAWLQRTGPVKASLTRKSIEPKRNMIA